MIPQASDLPTPEFRAHLEWEIARAMRREQTIGTRSRPRGPRRLRMLLVGLACLGIGVGSNIVAAQVQGDARKDSLLQAVRAEMDLVKLRLDLARKQYADAEQKAKLGVSDDAYQQSVESTRAALQAKLDKLRLDMAEIQAGSQAARDELNAPLVKGRDFVREWIEVALTAAQERVAASERSLADMEQKYRVGVISDLGLSGARLQEARAQADLAVLAERLRLRSEYLAKGTPAAQLVSRLDETQRTADLQLAIRRLEISSRVIEQARKQRAAGTITDLDLLRAELEYKELQVEVANLKTQLEQVKQAAKRGGATGGG